MSGLCGVPAVQTKKRKDKGRRKKSHERKACSVAARAFWFAIFSHLSGPDSNLFLYSFFSLLVSAPEGVRWRLSKGASEILSLSLFHVLHRNNKLLCVRLRYQHLQYHVKTITREKSDKFKTRRCDYRDDERPDGSRRAMNSLKQRAFYFLSNKCKLERRGWHFCSTDICHCSCSSWFFHNDPLHSADWKCYRHVWAFIPTNTTIVLTSR